MVEPINSESEEVKLLRQINYSVGCISWMVLAPFVCSGVALVVIWLSYCAQVEHVGR